MDQPNYENVPSIEKRSVLKTHPSFEDVVVEDVNVFEPGGPAAKTTSITKMKIDTNLGSTKRDGRSTEHSEALELEVEEDVSGLHYKIEDIPSWFDTLGLAFQVYLMMAGTTVSLPFVIGPAMCMKTDDVDMANVVSTFVFVSGIITILQSSFGTRLPIVQGGSTAFMIPTLAILRLDKWKCPDNIDSLRKEEQTELWQTRMREIQGAIIVASLFQVAFGFFGLFGIILRYITPMTVAPSITMIGLSLFGVAGGPAGTNWAVSLSTVALIILFSQYLRKYKIPIPFTKSPKRDGPKRYPLFQNLPIFFGVAVMWIVCAILTVSGGFSKGDQARTDTNIQILVKSPWFRVPFPFQWGIPTVTIGAVFGILAGCISGIIESIGDYYACARVVGARAPPVHAINRGIFVEGIGCIVAGIWGTGNGTTSYSENIGAIGVTQVGSRRVIQVGGLLMIMFSLFCKLNALFVTIPGPIVGAFLIVVFSMVTALGLSNLKGVDFNSPRNIFIIGFSIFFSLTVSQWMNNNPNAIKVGNDNLNQMISIFLSAGMFLGGVIGFILDNTVPGTRKERGLDEWESQFCKIIDDSGPDGIVAEDGYDLPFVMLYLHKSEISKWIPISPTFEPEKYQNLLMDGVRRVRGVFGRRHR